MSSSNLPLIDNENDYLLFRQKLLAQPTVKQTQVAESAATVVFVHNENGEKQVLIKRDYEKFKKNLFVHCTYEKRLKNLAHEIHTIHDSYFKNTDQGAIRLVVGYRNNPNIEFELSRKRPPTSILKDPSKKKSNKTHYLLFRNSKMIELLLFFSSCYLEPKTDESSTSAS
jgi:hypothetical protein